MSSSPLPWGRGAGGEGKTFSPSGFSVKLTPMHFGSFRLRYLGFGSIERLVLSVVEVSRDARHKSGQVA